MRRRSTSDLAEALASASRNRPWRRGILLPGLPGWWSRFRGPLYPPAPPPPRAEGERGAEWTTARRVVRGSTRQVRPPWRPGSLDRPERQRILILHEQPLP